MFEYINIGNIFRDRRINPIIVQLTDYGTVFINSDEYILKDFEKALNHDYHTYIKDFYYDERVECFHLVYRINEQGIVNRFNIYITEKQKELIRNGYRNDNIERLMQIANRKENDKKKKDIDIIVQETGELPSNNEEIILYAEYLEEQLAEKKAEITKSCRKLMIAPSIALLSIYEFISSDSVIEFLLSIFGAFSSLILFDGKSKELTNLIENINIFKTYYYKLLLLKEKVQELASEEKKTTASLPEAPKVKKYS